ncbi:MAG TPA: YdeI/OmpD-associated family protein, partial [Candidatus Limnocylindria bacterium]|nr:YdeI/OmpD-associated family protein [Candidatus Limnocylindria bacterium]
RFELDTEPRVVEPPPELAASLASSAQARAIYDKLAFSHQKAYADWVAEAKRPETRVRRAAESVKRLLAGGKEPNG